MPRIIEGARANRSIALTCRAMAVGAGVAAILSGGHVGADAGREEWFGSPVSGTTYHVRHDAETGAKSLVGPDGRRFPSIAAIVEAEMQALSPIERLIAPDLLEVAADPARAEELVDVTFIFRRQPAYEAGVAARERANPILQAALDAEHRILDRIAPLRTLPGGRAPTVEAAMREEAALLTDEEKKTLRDSRDAIFATLAAMRREVFANATPSVEADQAALKAFIAGLPGALDFGGTVTLNARSARIPARALAEISERFPEVLRVERITQGEACTDTAVPTVGPGSWWNANYNGSSSTRMCVIDGGVDGGHPALNGVVAASAVYHTAAAALGSTYGDNATSTDDLQGHGTTVAGMLASTNTTYRGIAYGGLIMNAKAAYLNSGTGACNMIFSDGRSAADWGLTNGATSLMLNYGGPGANAGTDEMALFFDAASFSLSVPGVLAAKNDGSSSSTVGYPGGAFNVITSGNFDDNGTTTPSDDSIFTTSGRGPTTDGRQKPDLCGPGVGITTTAFDWEGSNPDFNTFSPGTASGTSTVGPIVNGAVALLQDAGAASTPAGFKALLLTTASIGSPYGGPDNNWGYGVLNCGGAYTYRASVSEGQLTASGPRYVLRRGGALAAGGRATLVWSRQVTSAGSATPTTYYPIQDLDLRVYDESSGVQLGASTSTVDPNEQVAVSSAVSSPIYKVVLPGTFTTNYSTEPFALAAESTSSMTAVSPPVLTCTYTQIATAVAGNTNTVVTVRVANSGGFKAFAPTVTLTLPSGYSVITGQNPRTLSDLAAGANTSVSWTVRSHTGPSGSSPISVDASSTTFGETIASATLTAQQIVDVDPPAASVTIAAGAQYTTTRDVTVTLTATDAHSGLAQMRVRNAGAAWGAWTGFTATVLTTLPAGDGPKTFEAEFIDNVGNTTATLSDSIVYDTTPPGGNLRIADGASYANVATVTLTHGVTDALSGVAYVRLSNDGVNWGAWNLFTATSAWTLLAGEGTRTAYAQYLDGAGNTSPSITDSIVIETGAPSGTVVADGGAAWTRFLDVTLTLSASDAISGVSRMRFSNDGTTWSAFRDYATTAVWTLPAGSDGPRTVYAQFQDGAGNVSPDATDAIGLDTTPPAGTVKILSDAAFTSSSGVTLDLAATDALNGVAEMRFSNDATTWGGWVSYAATANWALAGGDGQRTVFAQFKDGVGNVSSETTDTIVVDTVVPTGSIAIEGNSPAINTPSVVVNLTYADGGSGVAEARLSNDATTWSDWTAAQATLPWAMEAGDGPHTVYAEFRDRAGNVSATSSDSIVIDSTPPTGTFVLSDGAAYTLPWETIVATTTASDGAAGTGVAEFRSSGDSGATWSNWTLIPADGKVTVARPASGNDKLVTFQGQFRDVAKNVSEVATETLFVVDAAPTALTQVASFTGTAGPLGDMDAFRMALVKGDKLSLKLKAKPLLKKADAHIDIDMYGPGHAPVVTGRFPAESKKTGVTGFVAPETGEYWIVLRSAGTAADTGVSYTMSVANAAAKGSRALKGSTPPVGGLVRIPFDAVDGLRLTGTLTVPAADTSEPRLISPNDTLIPLTVVRGKPGSMKISVDALASGAGRYAIALTASGPVTFSIVLTPAKGAKLIE